MFSENSSLLFDLHCTYRSINRAHPATLQKVQSQEVVLANDVISYRFYVVVSERPVNT